MCTGEWPSAPTLTYLFNVHQFTVDLQKIHFVSLRFEPALSKNLFNDSTDSPFLSVLC